MHDRSRAPAQRAQPTALIPTLRDALGASWRWWRTEMDWLIAPIARRVFGVRAPLTLVTDAAGKLALSELDSEVDSGWEAVCTGRQVIVLLHPAHVMRLTLTLPRSARGDLRAAVRYRMAVEAPVDESALYFDVGDITGAPARDEIRVEVALCKRALVAELEAAIERAKARACVVGFSPAGSTSPKFKFHASRGMQRSRSATRINRWLFISAACIVLTAGPALFAHASWLGVRAQSEIEARRAKQGNVIQLAEVNARIIAIREQLAQAQRSSGALRVMEDIATHLPKQAWISRMEYESGRLKLSGYAADPAATARALEQAASLTSVKLESVSRPDGGADGVSVPQFALNAIVGRERSR